MGVDVGFFVGVGVADSDVAVVGSVGSVVATVGATYASALLALILLLSKKNANATTPMIPRIAITPIIMLQVGAPNWNWNPVDLGL